MNTHNLCFEQKYKKNIRFFLSENFPFLVVKFSIYLNRHVLVMGNQYNVGSLSWFSLILTASMTDRIL